MKRAGKISRQKSSLRDAMRKRRQGLKHRNSAPNLRAHLQDFLSGPLTPSIIAGYAPIGDEIDVWPLLKTLHAEGRRIALPVVTAQNHPLIFQGWNPTSKMKTDHYGVAYPVTGEILRPHLVLVPLLAFTHDGKRLGYGGGYYDRTLETLREDGEIFACGVAYAGQEIAELPTETHDAKLDGILTENGFKAFA